MTRIILSTGDKYVVASSSAEIMEEISRGGWINIEDSGRDIAVRSDHIIAVEDITTPIIKEADVTAEKSSAWLK